MRRRVVKATLRRSARFFKQIHVIILTLHGTAILVYIGVVWGVNVGIYGIHGVFGV